MCFVIQFFTFGQKCEVVLAARSEDVGPAVIITVWCIASFPRAQSNRRHIPTNPRPVTPPHRRHTALHRPELKIDRPLSSPSDHVRAPFALICCPRLFLCRDVLTVSDDHIRRRGCRGHTSRKEHFLFCAHESQRRLLIYVVKWLKLLLHMSTWRVFTTGTLWHLENTLTGWWEGGSGGGGGGRHHRSVSRSLSKHSLVLQVIGPTSQPVVKSLQLKGMWTFWISYSPAA